MHYCIKELIVIKKINVTKMLTQVHHSDPTKGNSFYKYTARDI